MPDIFISWSKDRSRRVAASFKALIGATMDLRMSAGGKPGYDILQPDLSRLSEDLPKGGNWFQDLAGQLENAAVGIICVTPENKASPWLLFEAGALLRCDRDVRLFPVLLDLEPHALEPPLSMLQSTVLSRDPEVLRREATDLLFRVVRHISDGLHAEFEHEMSRFDQEKRGKSGKTKVSEPRLRWIDFTPEPEPPDDPPSSEWMPPMDAFCNAITRIEPAGIGTIVGDFGRLFDRKTFREPFEECSDQRWLDRYAAATLARDRMDHHRAQVEAALPPGAGHAYRALRSAVDSYVMTLAGQLLDEQTFKRDPQGRLRDADGRLAVCERRRRDIEERYLRLCDPVPPVFDDARVYEELKDLSERKIRLIHPLERRLEAARTAEPSGPGPIPPWRLDQAKASAWLYDRLVYYIYARFFLETVTNTDLLDALGRECQIIEVADAPKTLVGIYYALETLQLRSALTEDELTRLGDLAKRIDGVIERWRRPFDDEDASEQGPDANRRVRDLLVRLTGRSEDAEDH